MTAPSAEAAMNLRLPCPARPEFASYLHLAPRRRLEPKRAASSFKILLKRSPGPSKYLPGVVRFQPPNRSPAGDANVRIF